MCLLVGLWVMSKSWSLQHITDLAEQKGKKYCWVEAGELYEKALHVLRERDSLRRGEIQEKIGFCLHRAAFQAESRDGFRQGIQRAIEAYDRAQRIYREREGEQQARMLRARALVSYLGYWLARNPSEKRKLLDECLELEKNALDAFLHLGNMLEYGRTYNDLSLAVWHRAFLEWDLRVTKRLLEEGRRRGEKAVAVLTELGDSHDIAGAYLALGIARMLDLHGAYFIPEPEKQEEHRLRVVENLHKATEFAEGAGDAYLMGLSYPWLGLHSSREESINHCHKAVECGEETRDNYLRATALDLLAYETYWKALATEDPDQRRELAEEAMEFYERAQHHFSMILYSSPRWGAIAAPGGYAEHFFYLSTWEIDLEEKLQLLEKSEEAGLKALKMAEDSDIPLIISTMLHILSKTLEARASLEPDADAKSSLLERALGHRERNLEIVERLIPFDYWDRGVMWGYLSQIRAELGYLAPDNYSTRRLLEEAASNKEKCLRLIAKAMPFYEKMGRTELFAALYDYQDSYGTLLSRLYELTENPGHLRGAIEILHGAIESASKLDMVSLIAESYWKIAKAKDVLGKHLEAAEEFKHASENFEKAAEKIPQLRGFYQDYSSYMHAWSEIEEAKHHHVEKGYGKAKEHYEKAASLHRSTGRWDYLGSNYLAWARLEEAEDFSRMGRTEEAKDLFQQAADLFMESKKSITPRSGSIEGIDEEEMSVNLVKACGIRFEYCLGRIDLEEAKILDRQGDHAASSRKYGNAARIFQAVIDAMEHESDRQELRPIVHLCEAWQLMTQAEAEASPSLYSKASQLFDKAKEYVVEEKTRLLALGHSSFCKALEAGTRFEAEREIEMHSMAKRHLEASANYYLKAGFENASEYARATGRLLDAYVYMHKAETEIEPRKRAQHYRMAERLLQASAGSYMKARHPEKEEQVQRLLRSVKEEKELAASLTEVLHAPTIMSSTASFSTPTPTYEKPVGLERFEHADIQANFTFSSQEVTAGEETEIRLDLVNIAKNSGLLVRVDNLVPPGFRATESPSRYSLEDGSINLKGRRLEPLKVETIRLSLQATEAGVTSFSPKVTYVDEVGKFRTCAPEPATMTVHPRLAFEFKTKTAQSVFDYLIDAFVDDYMRGRIAMEKSGWRTLMEIVKHGRVSRSSVYGARGSRGRALSELERRGLVETRIFPGERGRGGRIQKVRIFYEKETIRRYIDQRVMKNTEK